MLARLSFTMVCSAVSHHDASKFEFQTWATRHNSTLGFLIRCVGAERLTLAALGQSTNAASNGYKTVFTVSHNGFDWKPVLISGLLMASALALTRLFKSRRMQVFAWGYAIFAGFFLLIATASSSVDYTKYVSIYKKGHYQVLTGIVQQYEVIRSGPGHRQNDGERFSLDNVHFSYSEYGTPTPCFHRVASAGGPIRNGLGVRIAYTDNCILSLEVESPSDQQ
jgi:hypothetical protein